MKNKAVLPFRSKFLRNHRLAQGRAAGRAVAWVVVLLVSVLEAGALDAPHQLSESAACTICHLDHDQFGNQIGSKAGNANVCLSCHQVGGSASHHALAQSQQAKLWPAVGGHPQSSGTSHRWDAGAQGRIESVSGAPLAAIAVSGGYTGRYAASYTLTITSAGNAGVARFDWAGAGPGTGAGTNVLTGANVVLEAGVAVSFLDTRVAPAFQPGDTWRIMVWPGLQAPGNTNMLHGMADGNLTCATCHNPHSQEMEPFDPQAPPYMPNGGAGRHFLRAQNDQDQMCQECHASRFVTNALAGSHPVGVLVGSNALVHPPGALPRDKTAGQMWCSTCHQVHNSPAKDGSLLRKADSLCSECHALADTTRPAIHLNARTGPLWPGGKFPPQLPAHLDPTHRGGCGNCHRVHGWPDPASATNNYPGLLVEREEYLCYTCHDGTQGSKNLAANFAKAYRHPVAYSGRHTASEDGNPALYGTANRHAECVDCHNPHQLDTDRVPALAPAASSDLRGVARVSVTNVSATVVRYTFRGGADATPVKEYEVCFTCHSGWTTRPSGQADYAAKFNTLTASFHPIESVGKNSNINVNAFVNGWKPDQMMTCTDCHTSDDPNIRGPHGSAYQYILKKSSPASPASRTMANTELCFDCHNYDTYANNSATTTVKNYSRFGGGHGHAYHVGSRHYTCYTCHETHGATSLPNLLVTGRSPGIKTYTRTSSGGSCTATCHSSESYSVAYPR